MEMVCPANQRTYVGCLQKLLVDPALKGYWTKPIWRTTFGLGECPMVCTKCRMVPGRSPLERGVANEAIWRVHLMCYVIYM